MCCLKSWAEKVKTEERVTSNGHRHIKDKTEPVEQGFLNYILVISKIH